MSEPSDPIGAFLKVCGGIFDSLKKHPEKLFFTFLAFIGAVLLLKGIDPMYAVGLPVACGAIYLIATIAGNLHKRQMSELGLKRLEITKGNAAREKASRALERRKGKAQR